jgi:hypothetical protein
VTNSQNGGRIKSNYNTTGFISNITYSNIAVSYISIYGIDIQQDYLNGGPTGIPSNGVIITDLTFSNVTGTAIAGAEDYYILCGDGSCSDFTFTDVNIVGDTVADSCNYPPSGCPGSSGTSTSSSVPSSTIPTSSTTTLSSTSTSAVSRFVAFLPFLGLRYSSSQPMMPKTADTFNADPFTVHPQRPHMLGHEPHLQLAQSW